MTTNDVKPLTLPEGVTIENGAQMFTYLMDTKENNPIVDLVDIFCKTLGVRNPLEHANLRTELHEALKFDKETFIGIVDPLFSLLTGKTFQSVFPDVAHFTPGSDIVVVHSLYLFERFYERLSEEVDSMDFLLQGSTVFLSTILLISYIKSLPAEDDGLLGYSFDFESLTVVRCEGEEENYGIKLDGDKISIDSNGEWLPCKRPSELVLALHLTDLGIGIILGKMQNCDFEKEFITNICMASDIVASSAGYRKEGLTLEDFMSVSLPSYIRNYVDK